MPVSEPCWKMNVNMLEISADRSRRQRGEIPSGPADFDGFNEASCLRTPLGVNTMSRMLLI